MPLFLTCVLPFLAHDHPSAVALLTCRHHNFHSSIIPEFLSDEERLKSFYEARQNNQLEPDKETQYTKLYKLFVQTPLMQFSPSLILRHEMHRDASWANTILKPLLATKYFTRTLQRCVVALGLTNDLFHALSKVRSLTQLVVEWSKVDHAHLDIIINSFYNLETLTICDAGNLWVFDASMVVKTNPPTLTKSLRHLTLKRANILFATEFVSIFSNLRKLVLSAVGTQHQLDLLPLSSSLPLLADLSLECCALKNAESLNTLVHLSSLLFQKCLMPDSLNFLTPENSLPQLTMLRIDECDGLSTSSFTSLANAPNLQVLKFSKFGAFNDADLNNNDCLQYLENMVHLRKLDLSNNKIVDDSRSLKSLIQNWIHLEELNLSGCRIGNQGTIAQALYNNHSRLRVLNLSECSLVDDDLKGIDALKNTLEVLDLSRDWALTNEALDHCKDLVKLKSLNLLCCDQIDDLSSLKDCVNLEQLNLDRCKGLVDGSFKVFSEEPNSFPNLRILDLSFCFKLTGEVFEHLSKNTHLVYQLKELHVVGLSITLSSSATARNNICQLKGLRQLHGISACLWRRGSGEEDDLETELIQRLRNIEEIQ